MTGFGEARNQAGGLAVVAEVRTINSRHFKLSYRSSEGYAALEPEVEAIARDAIRRGTVQLNLRVDRPASVDDYRINTEVLDNYRRQLKQYTGPGDSDDLHLLRTMLLLPGAVDERSRGDYDPREDWPTIEPVVRQSAGRRRQDARRRRASPWPPTWPTTADRSPSSSTRLPADCRRWRNRINRASPAACSRRFRN